MTDHDNYVGYILNSGQGGALFDFCWFFSVTNYFLGGIPTVKSSLKTVPSFRNESIDLDWKSRSCFIAPSILLWSTLLARTAWNRSKFPFYTSHCNRERTFSTSLLDIMGIVPVHWITGISCHSTDIYHNHNIPRVSRHNAIPSQSSLHISFGEPPSSMCRCGGWLIWWHSVAFHIASQ